MGFIVFLCEGTHWIAEVIKNISNAGITLTSPIELGDISKFEELNEYRKRSYSNPFELQHATSEYQTKTMQGKFVG